MGQPLSIRPQEAHATATAAFCVLDPGVVAVRVKPGPSQSMSDAKENLGLATALAAGSRPGLLIDISRAQPLTPEVRHYYSGEPLRAFAALALLIEISPFGRMMGNVYLRIARPGIPTALFTNESAALEWLRRRA